MRSVDAGTAAYHITALRQHPQSSRWKLKLKLAQRRQRRKRYLGRRPRPSNTALRGTQQTRLAFSLNAAPPRKSSGTGGRLYWPDGKLSSQLSIPSPEYASTLYDVCLRNIIISESNKHSLRGLCSLFHRHTVRDGAATRDVSSISGHDRKVHLMAISRWLTALLGGLQPHNLLS